MTKSSTDERSPNKHHHCHSKRSDAARIKKRRGLDTFAHELAYRAHTLRGDCVTRDHGSALELMVQFWICRKSIPGTGTDEQTGSSRNRNDREHCGEQLAGRRRGRNMGRYGEGNRESMTMRPLTAPFSAAAVCTEADHAEHFCIYQVLTRGFCKSKRSS